MKFTPNRPLWWALWRTYHLVSELAFPVLSALGCFSAWCRYFRWLLLAGMGMRRLNRRNLDTARRYAHELLREARFYKLDWNYGNAVHKGHTVLGLIALRQGDVGGAMHHLDQAGKTPGSAQLDTFGPNMRLAKELLEIGETQAVLEYFSACSDFWDETCCQGLLDHWADAVRRGSVPNFGANLLY